MRNDQSSPPKIPPMKSSNHSVCRCGIPVNWCWPRALFIREVGGWLICVDHHPRCTDLIGFVRRRVAPTNGARVEFNVGFSALRCRRTFVGADTAHYVRGCARLVLPGWQSVLSTHARVPLNSRPDSQQNTRIDE